LLTYAERLMSRSKTQQQPLAILDVQTAHESAQESLQIWTKLRETGNTTEAYVGSLLTPQVRGMGSARLLMANASSRLEKLKQDERGAR